MAWSPFLTSDTRLVLCQGWPLRPDNVDQLLVEVATAWTHIRRTSAMHNKTVQTEVRTNLGSTDLVKIFCNVKKHTEVLKVAKLPTILLPISTILKPSDTDTFI